MASDNEEDDLDALREAALATLKQKVQPIENVFSGNNATRAQESAAWSDVPASIDFPAFSDPIPEQNHFPTSFGEPASQPPLPHQFFGSAANLPWNSSHQNRVPSFQNQRMRHPRFPHRTFGDIGGHMHDRGNRRLRPRGYLPPQPGRGGIHSSSHPHHPTNVSQPTQVLAGVQPVMGANLIVIQPHIQTDVETAPSSTFAQPVPVQSKSSSMAANHPQSESTHARSKLVLPQDKYHASDDTTSKQGLNNEPEPKAKSKDKFSRYNKSDSEEDEDDDVSEVDDIANEIDKVLQDNFLAEEIAVQEVEETEMSGDKTETKVMEKDQIEDVLQSEPSSPVASEKYEVNSDNDDPKTPTAATSDISDSESLDLDALAGGDPVIGDFEDLDSLVDKEPEGAMNSIDQELLIDRESRQNSNYSNDSDRNSDSKDKCVSTGKKDSEIRGSSVENSSFSKRQSPFQRRSPLSPKYHNHSSSPSRYRSPVSPRKYDSYNSRAYPSPQTSRSPLYSRRSSYRRSTSPKSFFRPRSRSPYSRKSPLRRSSISPRRRAGSPSHRRHESSPRRYPVDRARRRSLSPNRWVRSPPSRERYRFGREDLNRHRDYYNSRPEEVRHKDLDRYHRNRDRPQAIDREKSENQREPDAKIKNTDKKNSPINKRISPLMEKNTSHQEKEKISIDLEKLPPDERAKIEARRKKFDSRTEVNVTEASKKISLKDIKKREKKAKKKAEKEGEEERVEEIESVKIEESLPDVINKKTNKSGISLKKLRKKQESKKKKNEEEEVEQASLQTAGLEDESEEDSDEGRSWRKESSGTSGPGIKFGMSRTTVNKTPLVSLDSIGGIGGRKYQDSNRRRYTKHQEQISQSGRLRENKFERKQNNRWSSDEDSDNGTIQASCLSSSVVTSKPFEADVPPEKLRIQVQIASKDSKKKSKAVPDFSNIYSVHAKRRHTDSINSHDQEKDEVPEEVVPVKKYKKKKEKKKKQSKEDDPKSSHIRLIEEEEEKPDLISKSPAKPSVLERLGKKVSLDSLEKKEKKKKKSKKSRDIDEDTDDLDLHILKMKAKNEEILRRQREIQLDKERYG